jgi:O-antigen ligase
MRRRSSRTAPPGGRIDRLFAALLGLAASAAIILFGAVRWWAAGPVWAVLFLVAALLGIRLLLRPGVRDAVRAPGLVVLCAIPLYILARVFWRTVSPADTHAEFLTVAGYLAAYAAWSQLKPAGARWRFWVGSFLFLASLLCWYALILNVRGEAKVLWMARPETYGMRASGTFGCPNHFGHFLVVAFSFALAFALTKRAGAGLRIVSLYSLILIPCALVLTYSRGAMVGLLVATVFTLGVLAFRRRGRLMIAAAVLVPVVLAISGYVVWRQSPAWQARVAGVAKEDMRLRMWKDTVTLWKADPAWGSGPGTYASALAPHRHHLFEHFLRPQQAHSEPLQALAEYGAVGTVLLVVAGAWTLFGLVRALGRGEPVEADTGWMAALIGAWAGSVAHSVVEFNFHIPGNVLLLASLGGLCAARLASVGRLRSAPLRPWAARLAGLLVVCAALALLFESIRYTRGAMLERRWSEAVRRGQPAAGLEDARAAAALRPGFAEAHRFIGVTLQRQAFWLKRQPARLTPLLEEAERHLTRAIALNRLDLDARIALARVRLLQGRDDEAVAIARQVGEDSPAVTYYRREMARVLVDAKRYQEAHDAFVNVRKTDYYDQSAWAGQKAMRRLLGMPDFKNEVLPPRPYSIAPGAGP